MRHHNSNRKFGRKTDQRRALLRVLATSLVKHGKIKTTEAKAKELRPFVEKLVSLGRANTVASKRLLVSKFGGVSSAVTKTVGWSSKYADRKGGYTRIVKLPPRKSDGSKMAVIEFV
ncbi:MAG: 50S ribosomal protein L17 [Candidatus Paceibacterota bacterium]|jgi:large subunit ribosomal protein L17